MNGDRRAARQADLIVSEWLAEWATVVSKDAQRALKRRIAEEIKQSGTVGGYSGLDVSEEIITELREGTNDI